MVAAILLSIIFILFLWSTINGNRLGERHYAGDEHAPDKIAIVRVDGPILEGFLGYANQQLQEAARDEDVKAVVLAINSPGGSVTASDQLWKKVKDLRDGRWEKQTGAKPIVVSMGSIAASGGYYIAAPADKIYAEPTTITGSIGVYAPFLDLHKLAQDHGIAMNLIKKGELKASGSMFHEMTAEERIEWDEMLETIFQRFMTVVREGRNEQKQYGKRLKYDLRDEIKLTSKDGKPYVRRLADGGIYTADQAKEYGLIDGVGYMDDAIAEAKRLVGLSQANVIAYNRPPSLLDLALSVRSQPPETAGLNLLDVPGATARLWLMTPGYELSGVKVSSAGR
jgi:protease-4